MRLNDCGVRFEEDDHTYWLGELQLQGITGVISKHLFPDKYANVPENMLKRAAERGHIVHEDIFWYNMTGIKRSVEAEWYAELKEKSGFNVVDSEYLVTDGKNFASAIDQVVDMDGIFLADIKTTYKLDMEYLSWQLSIYKYLFNLVNPDIPVKGLVAIWLRDGASLHTVEEIPQEQVIELLRCEVLGEKFVRKELANISEDDENTALILIQRLNDIVTEIKELEERKNEFQRMVSDLFSKFNIDSWETDMFRIVRVKAYERETFDKASLKKDHPDIYEKYVGKTIVSESIKATLKKT